MTQITVAQIAELAGGQVTGSTATLLTGLAPADLAKSGDLTFAESDIYFAKAEQSAASAILVAGEYSSAKKVLIRVANARVAFAKVLPLFFPEDQFEAGIHPSAVIAKTARIDPTAHIGPFCTVGDRATIAKKAVLVSHNFVGADCAIGAESRLFPSVVIYPKTKIGQRVRIHSGTVIGSDGFGYVEDAGRHLKIPQIGHVIIHDDVEIGANVTVDRGALGPTIIGRGTKVDNLVQIAHNVVIGEHCLLVAQVGIAGSAKLGDHVTVAGQAGIAGHIKVGSRTIVAGQSGLMRDTEEGEKVFGLPAQPIMQTKRQMLALQKLPGLLRQIATLEKRLSVLESKAPK